MADGTGCTLQYGEQAGGLGLFYVGHSASGKGMTEGLTGSVVLQAVPTVDQPPQAEALLVAHTGPLAPLSEGQTEAQSKGGPVMGHTAG